MEREKIRRPIEEVRTKFIGLNVPLPLHEEFRAVAKREGITGTGLLRKLIVRHLDRAKR